MTRFFRAALTRYLRSLTRPSPQANLRRLHQRGADVASFRIREAGQVDVPALAELHVKTWNATHRMMPGRSPTVQLLGSTHQDLSSPRVPTSGPGRRLFGHAARRFLDCDIGAMMLFSQAENPACGFFEALGGERLLSNEGEFHGAYGWRDLHRLASACPIDGP